MGDIISNIFGKGDQKLPETKLIEEKLKEINNPSRKKKKIDASSFFGAGGA